MLNSTIFVSGSSNRTEGDLSTTPTELEPDKRSMTTNAPKIIRTINGTELNSNNIILLRSSKTIDGSRILLRTDNFVKNNILLDDGSGGGGVGGGGGGAESKIGQIILQPTTEFKKGVYLQGVKRLGKCDETTRKLALWLYELPIRS